MSSGFQFRTVRKAGVETVDSFKERFKEMRKRGIEVGIPKDARRPDDGTSLAMIAAAMQFGLPEQGVPERPWLTGGINYQKVSIVRLNRINLRLMTQNKMTIDVALGQLGNMVVGNIRAYIRTKPFEALAESTLHARDRRLQRVPGTSTEGNTTPLIDQGFMIQALTYNIKTRTVL